MHTGSSSILSQGRSGRSRRDARLRNGRKSRVRWLDLDGLESRTLLATTPAAAATGGAVNLSGLSSVTTDGNANSPTVVIDPYDPEKIFAVWGVDLSSLTTVPHTTAVVEGAYSNNGGATWTSLGENVAPPQLDVATIDATPPTAYTQVTDPSVGFDSQHNVYVLTLQSSGAGDGELYLTEFNFSGNTPSQQSLPSGGTVYQWVTGSDAATDPTLAVDAARPPVGTTADPDANNVYIAWSSIDVEPANPNPYAGTGYNPNRAELIVGTPLTNASGNEESLAFSGVKTLNLGSNFGPQDDSHPQLVINQNDGGQVTVAWDDFGSGAKASPPFDELMSSFVQPGDSYGFTGDTGPIAPGTSSNNVTTPVSTSFTDSVNLPASAINAIAANGGDLTATIGVVDQESVQNLSLTLVAPNGVDQITLVANQNNAAGTANTGVGLPSGNAIGVEGFTTGATGNPGDVVGTVFDDNATRNIFDPTTGGTNGNAAPYIGFFRPEFGSLKNFLASEAAQNDINGTWTLVVTNYTATLATGVAEQAALEDFSLQLSTAISASTPSVIATTLVTGALGNTFARSAPSTPNGVGPGLVLAIDNTLGTNSPYQGRIYAAYVGYVNLPADPNGHTNPTTNTDIFLSYYDPNTQEWLSAGIVNDDNADTDGYSGSSADEPNPYAYTSGRTQFQPELAVDQATGTLVISWRDARDDAANARVATYLTTSLDGGNSFSPQTYANPSITAVDAITGQTDVLGPEADNQSSGNAQTDKTFGYGDQMGLAVFDGQVYPLWAGNLNQSSDATGTVIASPLNIWYTPMVIAAGPRIIDSTMGPIPLSEATSGSVTISVTFDRPVTISTFVKGDVQVFYHDTTNGDPSVPLTVTGIVALDGDGFTADAFQITFSTSAVPNGDYTGTYSYLIAPDNGAGLAISSPIETYIGTTLRTSDPMDQNADGTSDENPLTMGNGYTGLTPGDVYAVPTPAPKLPSIAFNATLEEGSTFVSDVISTTGTDLTPAAGLADGQLVTGMGISPGTTIASIFTEVFDGEVLAFLTLSASATVSGSEDLVAASQYQFKHAAYTGGPNLGGYILSPPFNQNTLPIIVPGPQVLSSAPGLAFTGTLMKTSTSVTGVLSTAGTGGAPAAGLFAGQVVTGPGIPAGTTILTVNTATGVVTLSAAATTSGHEDLVAIDSSSVVTDGTADTLSVTFDRPMQTSTFTPGQVDQIMGPTGSLSGPQYFPSTSSTGLMIPAATSPTSPSIVPSTLTIPSYNGTFTIADITVEINAAFSPDSDLTGVLIAPDGTQVTLFSGVGGTGSNFINTVFDDSADSSITTGTAPFTGSYRPAQSLSTLDGHTVDMPNPAAPSLWVPGVWTLQLTNSGAATGMLDNWSLNITPQIAVTPVNPVGGTATTFTIGLPLQQLSGTYTIQLGPNILDTFGEALDINQNAGLQVLRDQDLNGPTTTVHYTPTDLPQAIPAPTGPPGQLTPGQVSSTINVPDSFIIEGDQTAAGASVMQVQINLAYPTDADLTATLTHYDSAGNDLGSVILFSGVGGVGSTTANFDNTVFDDNAATPIQDGSAPFFSTFNPQESLATVFAPRPAGASVQGNWVLTIVNNSLTGGAGTFNGWSLTFQKPLPTSGLGEPGSDIATASFRIFTLGQTDALSSQQWTAVGPASIGGGSSTPGGDPSGRVTGLAIDPSDPSGNTVYAAGASGGIWKTTNFLTTDPAGPTWIPLTDFGPTSGVNIGGIAVFPVNNDPNQSIIIAATGEGDTGTPGVGFLISTNGGATWNLADSTDNVDASGNFLPINSTGRDREFVGNTSFTVVVDPKATPSGGVIIYAAMSGPNGGIWRSEDTGKIWSLLLAGQATSVALDAESGIVLNASTNTYVQGNLQIVYAAIRGVGVYMSPNQGQVWNEMLGGIGNPLIFNGQATGQPPNVNPVNGPTPNGAQGRITLAVPNPTGNAAEDAVYSGWLYALVANPAGALDGIFVTKDFGQNWTEVNIPTEPNQGYLSTPAIPTNDVTLSNYSVIGSAQYPQGNYNQAMAVDPTDPSVLYVGGTSDGNQAALIRIDLTDIWDAHAVVATSDQANDGGTVSLNSTGPATINNLKDPVAAEEGSEYVEESYLNYIRNPADPFVGNATLYIYNYAQFTNNGAGVQWIPLSVPGTDYHRMVTMVDPTTGLPLIIFGNDQGIWSIEDNNGTIETQVGASDALPNVSRNGNLQITQFYYGAAQPSTAAALIAGSLFYGSAQDNGGPASVAGVINSGNIEWNGPGGDAAGVATDQQGNGTLYQYWWPCCGGADTDFFQVNGVGETYGLLQASGGDPTPDPQWPFKGGANFAVNPVNGQDIVISSATGNIFSTTNEGGNWFDIGVPSVFGSPGSFSLALAYGAPDPTAPEGIGNLGNFIYVGTATGAIYVTQDGGGSGGSNNWINISTGLDGSAVQQIITDPTRGSHDAYAVTDNGVYFIANSIPSASNPTPTWINITGTLKTLVYSIFGQSYNPATDPNSKPYDQAVSLSSIAADWRYAIPNSSGKGTHPVLYVGADSGVFQSLNGGQTWTLFPDTSYGAVVEGGYLPHVSVTSLSLSLGDIAVSTGMPTLDGPDAPNASNQTSVSAADPDTLMAASYGQGEFAINLAPLIVANASGNDVTVSGTSPGNASTNGLPAVNNPITINGLSEITGFGNATWITVEDVTNPADPVVVAGFNPADPVPTPSSSNSTDGLGNFSIAFNPETYYATNGPKTIEVFATDNAGSVGNVVTYSFYLNPPTQLQFATPGEPPATALAGQNFASPSPVIVDVEDQAGGIANTFNGPVTLVLANNATGIFLGTLTVDAVDGIATFTDLAIDTAGTYELEATSPSLTPGLSTSITIDPAAASQLVWVTQPPSEINEGVPFGATLDLEDQYGNLETAFNQNVSVALELNGQPDATDLSGTIPVAASGGVATFTNLAINALGDPFTLTASGGGITSAPSNDIDVVAPVLVPGNGSQSVTAGVGFPLTWTAETYLGTTDTAFNGVVVLTIYSGPAGATIQGTTSANAVAGIATFSNVILDTAGTYDIRASSGNLVPGDTSVTVTAAAAAGLYLVQEPPTSVQAGAGFGFKVGAEDQYDNPVPLTGSITVTILNNPGNSTLGGVTTATASGGVATFTNLTLNKAGNDYTLQVSSSKLAAATTTGIDVTAGPASQLAFATEPPATAIAGQDFAASPNPVIVDAEDKYGNVDPTYNGQVTIALAAGATGTFDASSVLTVNAVQGVATFSNLAIDTVGTYQLVAANSQLGSATSTSLTVNPNPQPGLLAWVTEPPGQVTHDLGFGVTLDVEDRYGNLETAYDGNVSIALDNNPTGAILGGTTTVTASGGVATFSGLTVHNIGNNYTLVAMIVGVTSPDSTPFNVTPIPGVSLTVTTQPPSPVQYAQTFGLTVTALDQFGNPDPDFTGRVTVAISGAPGSTALGGTKTVTAVGGVATFSGLSLDQVGTVTLVVSSPGLTSATTGTIVVNPGSPTKLVVVGEPPSSLTAGTTFGFVVDAEDQYGNVATSFNSSLTAALSPGDNATLGGTNLTLAVNNGVANFTGLVVDKVGTGYTIQVTSTSLPSVTTSAFSVTPGPIAELVIPTQPTNPVTAGVPFGLSVSVADAFGNVVTGFNGPITIGLFANPVNGTLNGNLKATANNGLATFSGLSLDTAGSGYTIDAATNGLTPGISNPINVVAAAASHLVATVPPPTLMTAGAGFGLAIAAEDPFGNVATGFTGTVTIDLVNHTGGASLSGEPLTMAATGGVANFGPHLTIDKAGSGYTLQATSNGVTSVTTGNITVVPGTATQLVVQTQPPSFVTPGSSFGLVVAAADPYGNVNPSFGGQVLIAPPAGSGATLGGSTTVTASAGLASFTGLTLSGATTPVALQVTTAGLTGTATNPVSVATPAQFAFATGSVSVNETAGSATLQVVRSGEFQGAVSVNVATSGGTAVPGVNYTAINQVLSFAAGQDSQTITIPVKDAGVLAQALTVNVVLSSPGAGANLGSPSTATLAILNAGQSTSPTPTPLATMDSVQIVKNKKHQITGVLLGFSEPLNATEAASLSEYGLVVAGKHGSFTGKGTKVLKLRSAVYNPANDTVALTLKKPFVLKKPVQLTVNGEPPAGLEDSSGRLIDGNHDGQAGGNAVAVINRTGTTISARTAAVDLILEMGEVETVTKAQKK
jgi:subtilisin-like proprotein convertase family protein